MSERQYSELTVVIDGSRVLSTIPSSAVFDKINVRFNPFCESSSSLWSKSNMFMDKRQRMAHIAIENSSPETNWRVATDPGALIQNFAYVNSISECKRKCENLATCFNFEVCRGSTNRLCALRMAKLNLDSPSETKVDSNGHFCESWYIVSVGEPNHGVPNSQNTHSRCSGDIFEPGTTCFDGQQYIWSTLSNKNAIIVDNFSVRTVDNFDDYTLSPSGCCSDGNCACCSEGGCPCKSSKHKDRCVKCGAEDKCEDVAHWVDYTNHQCSFPSRESCHKDSSREYCMPSNTCLPDQNCLSCPGRHAVDNITHECVVSNNINCFKWGEREFCPSDGLCHPSGDCSACVSKDWNPLESSLSDLLKGHSVNDFSSWQIDFENSNFDIVSNKSLTYKLLHPEYNIENYNFLFKFPVGWKVAGAVSIIEIQMSTIAQHSASIAEIEIFVAGEGLRNVAQRAQCVTENPFRIMEEVNDGDERTFSIVRVNPKAGIFCTLENPIIVTAIRIIPRYGRYMWTASKLHIRAWETISDKADYPQIGNLIGLVWENRNAYADIEGGKYFRISEIGDNLPSRALIVASGCIDLELLKSELLTDSNHALGEHDSPTRPLCLQGSSDFIGIRGGISVSQILKVSKPGENISLTFFAASAEGQFHALDMPH